MAKTRRKFSLKTQAYRSAISNGTSIIGRDIDHRSTSVRRLRDLIAAHSSDLNPDSEAEKSLIRRASVLELELELLVASSFSMTVKQPNCNCKPIRG
jgi:hypothetical protein